MKTFLKIFMYSYICKLAVIQPGTLQPWFVQFEAQWLDQVQRSAGVGAQAYYISRVGWYLGLE